MCSRRTEVGHRVPTSLTPNLNGRDALPRPCSMKASSSPLDKGGLQGGFTSAFRPTLPRQPPEGLTTAVVFTSA